MLWLVEEAREAIGMATLRLRYVSWFAYIPGLVGLASLQFRLWLLTKGIEAAEQAGVLKLPTGKVPAQEVLGRPDRPIAIEETQGKHKLLVVRGDLRSETGWSRATRALVHAVAPHFSEIIGVDLHWHPKRSNTPFPWKVTNESTATRMAAKTHGSVVLHATLPDGILRYAGAANLGWWFWETDRIPGWRDWIERIGLLDHVLVPSDWQASVVRRLGLKLPVSVVPWPHDIGDSPEPAGADWRQRVPHAATAFRPWASNQLAESYEIDRSYFSTSKHRVSALEQLVDRKIGLFSRQKLLLSEAMSRYDGYFFAVQSDAPRKGLPVLIREWCRYHAQASTRRALVVRFSALNVHMDPPSVLQKFSEIMHCAARGEMDALAHVYVILDTVSEQELGSLYAAATAFVAPTYGEGFGGTLVEAAQQGCTIIAPRHTACEQVVPAHYPGQYQSMPYIGALVEQLAIQPANGTWHVPVPGEISKQLIVAETLSVQEQKARLVQLREHMRDALVPAKARAAFLEAAVGVIRSREGENRAQLGKGH